MQNNKKAKENCKKSNLYQVIEYFLKDLCTHSSSLYDIICNTFQNDPELFDLYKKNS